jgi:ABC-type nitrate/sulfonate/bicarbonate transport system substrate-binding protein
MIYQAKEQTSMRSKRSVLFGRCVEWSLGFGFLLLSAGAANAADRLTGLHSAQVMSQSMPWIAQEAGLFKKYDLDFRLVFIPSSPVATAATLNGDAEIGVTGAVGNVRAFVHGFTDLVFIAGMKIFSPTAFSANRRSGALKISKERRLVSAGSAATRITS